MSKRSSSPIREVIRHYIARERSASPLPSGIDALSSRPLLALFDADSLAESALIELIRDLLCAEPDARCIVAANRPLSSLYEWLESSRLESSRFEVSEMDHSEPLRALRDAVEVHVAPISADSADHILIERAEAILTRREHGALLVYTQDRGFLALAQRWRRARLPALIVALRDDESGRALRAHYQRRGVSAAPLNALRGGVLD